MNSIRPEDDRQQTTKIHFAPLTFLLEKISSSKEKFFSMTKKILFIQRAQTDSSKRESNNDKFFHSSEKETRSTLKQKRDKINSTNKN